MSEKRDRNRLRHLRSIKPERRTPAEIRDLLALSRKLEPFNAMPKKAAHDR